MVTNAGIIFSPKALHIVIDVYATFGTDNDIVYNEEKT